MTALVVVLLLSPVLAEAGDLRLVATGVDDERVVWLLDGVEVAQTHDRQAATVSVSGGAHLLEARSSATGRWQALARPDPVGDGAAYVPAWTAVHEPSATPATGWEWPRPALPGLLAAAAIGLMGWPGRRGLEVLRRRRRA